MPTNKKNTHTLRIRWGRFQADAMGWPAVLALAAVAITMLIHAAKLL